MAKKKRRSLADRYRGQIETEAQLRFAPQRRQLRDAVTEIADQLSGDVKSARGAARGVRESARAARPEVAKSSGLARGMVQEAQDTLASKLPGTLGATPALSAAALRDSEGSKRRLAESLNATNSELTSRETDAAAGAAFAESNARATASKAAASIRQKLADVASDEGAFKQGRLGELTEAARGRSTTRRGQDKSAATQRAGQKQSAGQHAEDRDAQYLKDFGVTYKKFRSLNPGQRRALIKRRNASKGKDAGPTVAGNKQATPAKRQEVSDGIGLALSQAKRLKNAEKRDRPTAATLLLEGRGDQTIKADKNGNPLTTPIHAPGVKKVRQLYASVALDVAYDGQVSAHNVSELHKLGISVNDLGLPTRTSRRKRQRESGRPTRTADGNTLQPRA